MGTARWETLKKQLEARSGHDFERAVFPLLKIRWPQLVHPKSLAYLDNSGIDQVLVGDGTPLEVVIQCKGFEVLEPLGPSQINQIAKSLQRLAASQYKTKLYVLAYNRLGADRKFETAVNALLLDAQKRGIAEKATLWNLSTLAKELSKNLLDHLLRELIQKANSKSLQERSRFRFGAVTVSSVPYAVSKMRLVRHSAPEFSDSVENISGDPLDAISTDKRSFSLIVGQFGTGKSTLAHRLSEAPDRQLVYVPAAALTHSEMGGSENNLAQAIVEYLGIFDDQTDLTPTERDELSYLAGPLLSSRFRAPDSGLILLIDAIDENRFYASMMGFQTLTNELARAQCPIIITTRLEHFVDSFQTYTDALGNQSRFSTNNINLLTLQEWEPLQVEEYIRSACEHANSDGDEVAVTRLNRLLDCVKSGEEQYDALRHPLFLAMTAELVAAGNENLYTRKFELYENWTNEKLKRDFRSDRLRPAGYENIRLLLSDILELMNLVANAMVVREHATDMFELAEYIEEDSVRKLAQTVFLGPVSTEIYAVTAFLEPQRAKAFGKLRLRFFHKSFQEYFTARHLKAHSLLADKYPTAVQDFLT